jgi:hypothetical protein
MPLSVECKTPRVERPIEVGTEVIVHMAAPVSSDPLHKELHELFSRVVNAQLGTAGRIARESEAAQASEMVHRAENVLESLIRRPEVFATGDEHWQCLKNVMNRALQTGGSFDIPEYGIAFVGVRNRLGDDAEAVSRRLLSRLQLDGFPSGESVLTIGDFSQNDRMSGVVPPIALWPLPREHRIGLLTGDLFLACVFKSDLWQSAFSTAGLSLEAKKGTWRIRGAAVPVMFDPLERMKLQLGIAFGGISPRAAAEAIRDAAIRISKSSA